MGNEETTEQTAQDVEMFFWRATSQRAALPLSPVRIRTASTTE
jgi:hypothetical protein